MLSGLAEYIFGSVGHEEEAEGKAADGAPAKGRPSPSMQITYTDDDWVLVDVTNSPKGSSGSSVSGRAHVLQSQSRGIPVTSQLEESWIVTPPPCFTAGGSGSQELATSPMENLLIEHPSMSVYGPRVSAKSRRTDQHESSMEVGKKPKAHASRVRHSQPPRRAAAVAARLGLDSPPNLSAIKEAEVMQRKKRGSLNRSKVERHNKTFHQQSCSRKRHYRQNVPGRHSSVTYKQC